MLNNFKSLIGIGSNETDLDERMELILQYAQQRLKFLLGGIEPPAEMEYIIVEVAVARFNRIGSEGLSSHAVEGESLSFTNDDFAPYSNEIQAFLDSRNETKRGKVRFI